MSCQNAWLPSLIRICAILHSLTWIHETPERMFALSDINQCKTGMDACPMDCSGDYSADTLTAVVITALTHLLQWWLQRWHTYCSGDYSADTLTAVVITALTHLLQWWLQRWHTYCSDNYSSDTLTEVVITALTYLLQWWLQCWHTNCSGDYSADTLTVVMITALTLCPSGKFSGYQSHPALLAHCVLSSMYFVHVIFMLASCHLHASFMPSSC